MKLEHEDVTQYKIELRKIINNVKNGSGGGWIASLEELEKRLGFKKSSPDSYNKKQFEVFSNKKS